MQKMAVIFGLILLLALSACSTREPEVSSQQPEQRPVAAAPEQEAERQPANQAEQQAQSTRSNEFMGQAPKIEDIPEMVVLEAKNGNVTLPHQSHAKRLDCATCHKGTPGEIPGFGKDQAHALCAGCHKEKKAGPTKCNECHKKS
jgi:predicted CXXCH cytochrome family protein